MLPANNPLCMLPVCMHPMTIMLVDDDEAFLRELSNQLAETFLLLTFSKPAEAIAYFEQQNSGLFNHWMGLYKDTTKLVQRMREVMYNKNRFKGIVVSVIDYEMPDKSGFDLINTMGVSIFSEMMFHSYILLTGKRFSGIDKKLAAMTVGREFISKWDPDRISQLSMDIAKKTACAFQSLSYPLARFLSMDPMQQTNVLFDSSLLPIINDYIQKQRICEMYLFDKQGSFIFLDEEANPHWFFIRNNRGMVNTIELAKELHAPDWVIDALWSKEKLLSLYEEDDIANLKEIDWDSYMLPAHQFKGGQYPGFIKLSPQFDYFYAFTDKFPAYKIDKTKIVSYRSQLNEAS
jgi:CheY-like chemotaxis protein